MNCPNCGWYFEWRKEKEGRCPACDYKIEASLHNAILDYLDKLKHINKDVYKETLEVLTRNLK